MDKTFLRDNMRFLSLEQRSFFDSVCRAVIDKSTTCFFLDAAAGRGKSFVLKLLLSYLRTKDEVALACASTGLAATLYEDAFTAHTLFGIPVGCGDNAVSSVTSDSNRAELLRNSSVNNLGRMLDDG